MSSGKELLVQGPVGRPAQPQNFTSQVCTAAMASLLWLWARLVVPPF